MKQNKTLSNGIQVHVIHDSKFQEVYMSLKILFPMEARMNTIANLLSRMMDDRLVGTETKQVMSERLDMMYGAKTASQTYSVGKYQVIDFGVLAIHDDFVHDDLLQKQIQFLSESLYQPLLNESTLQEAKNNLKLSFDQIQDQPSQYALLTAFQKAGEGQLFGLNSMGLKEDVDGITLADVQAFHQRVVHEFSKELYLVGKLADIETIDLSAFEVGAGVKLENALLDTKISDTRVDEFYQGAQSELVLVYKTEITPNHPLYYAYLVYIAYLGQLPSSLLFQNIREKHSLAYSIYATRRIFDGVFAIITGINDKNIDATLELIQEQIDSLKTTAFDIESAKSYLILQLESVTEKQKPWSDHVFRNQILGIDQDVADIQAQLAKVTSEDVMQVAQMTQAPFVYAYRGENHETND